MNNLSYWENRKTTSEELCIIKYLLELKTKSLGKLLHIGLGNSEALIKLNKKCDNFIGITIAGKELDLANNLKIKNNKNYLIDKYDSIKLNNLSLTNSLDYIIDINLKSFAPNDNSFELMLQNFCDFLKVGGKIITSESGMNFSSNLSEENGKLIQSRKLIKNNILSKSELVIICKKLNLKIRDIYITRRFFKGIWFRKKTECLYLIEK